MMGKENFHVQCQFLQEIHILCVDTLKNPRNNMDFAESYFQFISQLIRQNVELVNGSAIGLDAMLSLGNSINEFCKF